MTALTASVELLVLRPSEYKLVNARTLETIRHNFGLRTEWRARRVEVACSVPVAREAGRSHFAIEPEVEATARRVFGDELELSKVRSIEISRSLVVMTRRGRMDRLASPLRESNSHRPTTLGSGRRPRAPSRARRASRASARPPAAAAAMRRGGARAR